MIFLSLSIVARSYALLKTILMDF